MATGILDLVNDLNAADPALRRCAAERLSRQGDGARAAAMALVRASGDPDEAVREWAVAALEELGPPAVDDVRNLGERLLDEDGDVAYWSATLLGRLRDKAASAVPQLASALTRHPSIAARRRAAWALGMIGPAAQSAEPELQAATQSGDAGLARTAAQALEQLCG